jgi:hypothetical protein
MHIEQLEGRLRELQAELTAAGRDVQLVARLGREYARVESELEARLAEWGERSEAETSPG